MEVRGFHRRQAATSGLCLSCHVLGRLTHRQRVLALLSAQGSSKDCC